MKPIYLRAHCRTPIVASTDAPFSMVGNPMNSRVLVCGVWQPGLGWVRCPDCGRPVNPLSPRVIKVLP